MMKPLRIALPPLALALSIGCHVAPPAQPGPASPVPSAAASTPAAPEASPSAAAASLQGRVYDDDLAAMSDVTITAMQNGTKVIEAQTNAEGQYSLALPAGNYTVQATKGTYVTRQQDIVIDGAKTLDFGGQNTAGGNPYFLAQPPEIARVELKEDAPSGPLTLTLHMSEPLTEASRRNFVDRLELEAPAAEPFLRAGSAPEPYLVTESTWDEAGRVFTFRYAKPYLAGETYTLKLRQRSLDREDPVTRELAWEDMKIVDAEGSALGHGRADFAFLRPSLEVMSFTDMADKDLGFTPAIRRWKLTHTGNFAFRSAPDVTGPGAVSVQVEQEANIDGALYDLMELRFTEPMRVVKDRDTEQYTRLALGKELVVLNVSTDAAGANPKPLAATVSDIKFSRTEGNLVYLYFPSGTFKDQKWVEVTLGPDVRDPAGNKPDPAKSRVAGSVS